MHFSCVWLFVTPWTVACQASLSMESSRQEYWSGLPFPPTGYLPDAGIKPVSLISLVLALSGRFFTTSTMVQWGKWRLLIVRGDWSRLHLPQVLPSHLRLSNAAHRSGSSALLKGFCFWWHLYSSRSEISNINHHSLAASVWFWMYLSWDLQTYHFLEQLRPWTSPISTTNIIVGSGLWPEDPFLQSKFSLAWEVFSEDGNYSTIYTFNWFGGLILRMPIPEKWMYSYSDLGAQAQGH